jgi:hypothetical protein
LNETARVIRIEKDPVKSALFAPKVSGTLPSRHFAFRFVLPLTIGARRIQNGAGPFFVEYPFALASSHTHPWRADSSVVSRK